MNKSIYAFVAALLLLNCDANAAITIDTVPVGNPGNANDGTRYGGVGYNYSIGKYDVTANQYATFLNAVAATDTYGLYNPHMYFLGLGGIVRNGSSGSYSYSLISSPNHPVNGLSWGDAARFSNWLYNSQPTGAQGPATTETGSYTLNGSTSDAALNAITRNVNATWVIPTESEWYKAAFYNPASASYYVYPFSSSTFPTSAPPGNTSNTGNFFDTTTGYAVTGSTNQNPNADYLTDVGAYTASASPYGAFDMGGDVSQWTETLFIREGARGYRGGSYAEGIFASWFITMGRPSEELAGLRLALVSPNPLLSGDYNNDHHVNAADISALELAITNPTLYQSTYGLSSADLMQVDQVMGKPAHTLNVSDLQTLLLYLKSGGGSADPVPEPSTLALLTLGGVIAFVAKRRRPAPLC